MEDSPPNNSRGVDANLTQISIFSFFDIIDSRFRILDMFSFSSISFVIAILLLMLQDLFLSMGMISCHVLYYGTLFHR